MANLKLDKIDGLRADKKRRQPIDYSFKTKFPTPEKSVRKKAFGSKDD